jgi:hypothetical protein
MLKWIVLFVASAVLMSGCTDLPKSSGYRPEFDHRLPGYMHGNPDYPN